MTTRTDAYRNLIYTAPYEICIERAQYYTEAYQETTHLHPCLRAAHALEKCLSQMTIYILDEEQIVGNRSSKLVGAVLPVERGEINKVLQMDLKHLKRRKQKPFHIDPLDESTLMHELLPYWEGKTVRDLKVELWEQFDLVWDYNWGFTSWFKRFQQFGKEWFQQFYQLLLKGRWRHLREAQRVLAANNPNLVNNVFDTQGHFVLGNNNLIPLGYGALLERLKRRLAELTTDNADNGKNESANDKRTNNVRTESDHMPPSYQAMVEDFRARFSQAPPSSPENSNEDNIAFLQGAIITIEAAINYIQRFGRLAWRQAGMEGGVPAPPSLGKVAQEPHLMTSIEDLDESRRQELLQIADACTWIATNPPRTFREALQLLWFNQVIATISHGMTGVIAIGRVDQILWPYYERDLAEGRITSDEARELCEELLIKLSYNLLVLPSYGKATGSEIGADAAAITLGGVDRIGRDATNALSFLFLEATENVKSMTNSVSLRVTPGISPPEWLERSVQVFARTSGPALFNDEVIISALVKTGVSLEDARDYALIGCVEPTSAGNTFGTTSGNDISLVGLLEMVFTNGQIRNVARTHGVETGSLDQFTNYKEVWAAYEAQLDHIVDHMVKLVNTKDYIYGYCFPNPFISATMDGCIDRALDVTQGGAKYNFSSLVGRGLATAANSLCSIKQVVFDDPQITLEGLAHELDRNFRGSEQLRARLRHRVPKFGNDDDQADDIAREIVTKFNASVSRNACLRGDPTGVFRPGYFSFGMYMIDGFFLGATPDGRFAGEVVSNSFSPANGTEKQGPLAVLNSVTKIDATQISNGLSLNMRLHPILLETPEKRQKIAQILAAYFSQGGMHIQFNVVRQEDFLQAQIHPEQYLDLVVRVSGYSAYYIDLGKPLQEDIARRYSFENL